MPAGFVQFDNESNDEYLASLQGALAEAPDPWYPIIIDAHNKLKAIDPNYKVGQIKEKFGGLRYYYDSDIDFDSPERAKMDAIVEAAERAVDEFEARRRMERETAKKYEDTTIVDWASEGGMIP